MEDEPPLVTDVGPAMFSSSEVGLDGSKITAMTYLMFQGIRSEVKSMEDEPPLVTDIGPAMFSSSEVGSYSSVI